MIRGLAEGNACELIEEGNLMQIFWQDGQNAIFSMEDFEGTRRIHSVKYEIAEVMQN